MWCCIRGTSVRGGLVCATVVLAFAFVTACGGGDPTEEWPGPVTPLPPAPYIDAGWGHVCAIRDDGAMACWGSNEETDCPPWSDSPCFTHFWGQATPPEGRFASVSAGTYHTCGVRDDGTVACWGANEVFSCKPFGPCKVDYAGQSSPPAGLFRDVSAGERHTCGLRVDATIACWGQNDAGQSSPPPGAFSSVAAGGGFTCGLRMTGGVECWGSNWVGQTTAPDGVFQSISAGSGYTCGLRPDGRAECWGVLGGQTMPPSGVFKRVTAGSTHACGIRPDDSVECWGETYTYGSFVGGQFTGERELPTGHFLNLAAGYRLTCGVQPDATVRCWGGAYEAPAGRFKSAD